MGVNRGDKLKYYNVQKEINELKNCTFSPDLYDKRKLSGGENVYEKLHKDAKIIEQKKLSKVKIKDPSEELKECTFHPETNCIVSTRGNSAAKCAELYHNGEEQKIKKN